MPRHRSLNPLTALYNSTADLFERATLAVLRRGRLPRHVAFILDGNRRFARKFGAASTKFGHYEGFRQLERVLELCMQLNVETVTVYAFSIENFKRTKDEIDYLMQLFREAALVDEYEIQVRFLGNLDHLPKDVAELARDVMKRTKHNKKRVFNICCPYTSRDEMKEAIKTNVQMVQQGEKAIEEITEESLQDHLFTADCPPVDILVRTSGEIRLSDFLLWQTCKNCHVQFVNCFWPEFSLWQFLPILLEYQIYEGQDMVS
ncbi:cis-prenyltransferase [Apophysomyces sp. BC1034]|nr:cis-prenyltransferase [Apophysomyces sp. BC1015]KAG0178427.1 cis-prenyltransferase [Apophysomyces sp. BC1021]KAG0194104.1 cis-prenyltransferase [Apophysomyces sp. BC1034]